MGFQSGQTAPSPESIPDLPFPTQPSEYLVETIGTTANRYIRSGKYRRSLLGALERPRTGYRFNRAGRSVGESGVAQEIVVSSCVGRYPEVACENGAQ